MAWIEFYSTKLNDSVRINVGPDTDVYDEPEQGWTPYIAAKARAAKLLKRRHDIHPCASSKALDLHPHDWSDELDAPQ